jgi:transcriptional regulator with XRE-family HTH domain
MSIMAKNLRTIRKELRCTQAMMSDILKVGFRTYVRYEAGERDAPVSVLVKIARLGNLSLEQLLTKEVAKNLISPVKTLTKSSTPPAVGLVDFSTGQINLKNPSRKELLTIHPSERKLLSLFRKMDPELQKDSLDNIGKALKGKGKETSSSSAAKKKSASRTKKTASAKKVVKRAKSKASKPTKQTRRKGR